MAKNESNLLNMVLTLLIITAISATALGFIYKATKGPIEEAKKAKVKTALSNVLPEFYKVEDREVIPEGGGDALIFYDAYKSGSYIGTAIKTYTDNGFSGRFWIMVGFKPDGTIVNTAVLEHKETPGLGDKMEAAKSDFPLQFMDKHPKDYQLKVTKDGGDVDAITAATISSRAFCDAVQRAYTTFMNENKGGQK